MNVNQRKFRLAYFSRAIFIRVIVREFGSICPPDCSIKESSEKLNQLRQINLWGTCAQQKRLQLCSIIPHELSLQIKQCPKNQVDWGRIRRTRDIVHHKSVPVKLPLLVWVFLHSTVCVTHHSCMRINLRTSSDHIYIPIKRFTNMTCTIREYLGIAQSL